MRSKKILKIISIIVILFCLLICFLPTPKQPKVVWDVELLVDYNIDEILNIVGFTNIHYNNDSTVGDIYYEKEQYSFSIDFNHKTREVNSFLIVCQDGGFPDFKDMLMIGNLHENRRSYLVSSVTSWSLGFSNVTVIPN